MRSNEKWKKIEKNQMKNSFLSEHDRNDLDDIGSGIADLYFPDSQVDPSVIATRNQISYTVNNYGNSFDGLIECDGHAFHIYINSNKVDHLYSHRSRFTFAHELGHYFIDSHRNTLLQGKSPSHCSITGFQSKNRAERQADYFASCLLMPHERFQRQILRRKFEYGILDELSKKFGASLTSTAVRFCSIGNHPIMIVYSKSGEIVWWWSSDDFPFKWLLYGKDKLPEDTQAFEYFSGIANGNGTEQVWAGDWFNINNPNDVYRKFFEHARTHGSHCLSIIWEP